MLETRIQIWCRYWGPLKALNITLYFGIFIVWNWKSIEGHLIPGSKEKALQSPHLIIRNKKMRVLHINYYLTVLVSYAIYVLSQTYKLRTTSIYYFTASVGQKSRRGQQVLCSESHKAKFKGSDRLVFLGHLEKNPLSGSFTLLIECISLHQLD